MDCLKIQLPMVYDMIKTAFDGTNLLKSRLSVCLLALFGTLITQPCQHGLKQDLLKMKAVSLRLTNFIFTSL